MLGEQGPGVREEALGQVGGLLIPMDLGQRREAGKVGEQEGVLGRRRARQECS